MLNNPRDGKLGVYFELHRNPTGGNTYAVMKDHVGCVGYVRPNNAKTWGCKRHWMATFVGRYDTRSQAAQALMEGKHD